MTNVLLYCAVVLIWGTTWIMIKYQLGVVPVEASVAQRFMIAATLIFAWASAWRLPLRFSPRDHGSIALQGMLIFSINFQLFYLAGHHLATGLLAVIFSTASALTMVLNAIRARQKPTLQGMVGALLGTIGIGTIFWPELVEVSARSGASTGLALGLGGTLCFALGGMVSARNHAAGLSVRGSTAWAMAYGALLLTCIVVFNGESFTFDPRPPYVGSLLYLAVFGSVVAFACYFALLGQIGTERAAYATVLFPIVALSISTVFEDYQWAAVGFGGVLLTLLGNLLVLTQPSRFPVRSTA